MAVRDPGAGQEDLDGAQEAFQRGGVGRLGQGHADLVGEAPVSLLRAVVDREHRRPPSGQGPADGHAGDPQADHESAPRRQSRAPGIPMKSA